MDAVADAPSAAVPGWDSRIVGHGSVDPAEVMAHPSNWRRHGPDQQAALAALLDRVGWVQSVLVNRTTGHLVDGHLRVELALARHEPSVPVLYVELTEEEEALVLVLELEPRYAQLSIERWQAFTGLEAVRG